MSKKCNCGHTPTVIVPGIGQSKVDLIDENGNRIKSAWPLQTDSEELLKELKGPLMKMLLFRRDGGFSDKVAEIALKAAEPITCNCDGTKKCKCRVVSYNCSLAACNEEDKRYIYRMVPLEALSEVIGEDHLYFFAYDSYGQPYETATQLREFIQMVKRETGHDKVNLVPVSLGGAMSIAYFDAYGDDGDVDRVLNFVAALNGTRLVADILSGNIETEDHENLLGWLIGGKAKKLNDALKILPKDVPSKVIEKLLSKVIDNVIVNCPTIWAVLPSEDYEALRDKYLMDEKYDILREKTDRYHKAHLNYKKMIEKEMARGVRFFNICGYGKPLLPFSKSTEKSSDTIINIESSSMGAISAPFGSHLPDDYTQQNKFCSDTTHSHISPDKTIDATTGLLPDQTWYFKDQIHDDVAYNDVALDIATRVLSDKSFESIFSDAKYPQFNGTRNIRKIKYNLLPKAKQANRALLSDAESAKLDEAIEYAERFLSNTIVIDDTATKEVEARLTDSLKPVENDS